MSIEEAMQQERHKGYLNYFYILGVMSQPLKDVVINAVIGREKEQNKNDEEEAFKLKIKEELMPIFQNDYYLNDIKDIKTKISMSACKLNIKILDSR